MRRILAVVALLAIVLVGCGDDTNDTPGGEAASETSAPTTTEAAPEPFAFDVTSVDFGYELPTADIPAGPVLVTQTNEGDEAHQVTFIRLEDGQTPDQLLGPHHHRGRRRPGPGQLGGRPELDPAGRDQHGAGLPRGRRVRRLLLHPRPRPTGDDRAVHRHRRRRRRPPSPRPTETVGLEEFSFDLPDDFTGQGTIAVTNNGVQGHEMTIVQGEDQLPAGGVTVIAPGQTAYVDLALPPDDYTLLCFVLDPASGQLHGQLGMTKPFTIT